MSLSLSLWNVHSWLKRRKIAHSYSIHSDAGTIRGVRLTDGIVPQLDFAQLADAADSAPFSSLLAFGDNYIYFKRLSAIQALDEVNHMFAVYNEWYRDLKRVSLSHGALTELLRRCGTLLPFPLAVFQANEMIAAAPAYQEKLERIWNDYQAESLEHLLRVCPAGLLAGLRATAEEPLLVHSPLQQGKQVLLSCVLPDANELFALAAFAEGETFSPGDVHLVSLLADAVRTNLRLSRQMTAHRSLDPLQYFLACTTGEEMTPSQSRQILRRLGWAAEDSVTLFRFEMADGTFSMLLDKLRQELALRFPSAFCFLCANAVFLLFSGDSSAFPTEADFRTFLDTGRFVAGQSNAGTDFSTLPQLLEQARATLQTARRRGVVFLSSRELLPDYARRALYRSDAVQSLVHPAVRTLMRQDAAYQTEYTRTLRCYLFHGCNCCAASKALHIHRNTLLNRLERIADLTGTSLDEPETQEALLLSLLIAKPLAVPQSNAM